jgi:hypothetical protein
MRQPRYPSVSALLIVIPGVKDQGVRRAALTVKAF